MRNDRKMQARDYMSIKGISTVQKILLIVITFCISAELFYITQIPTYKKTDSNINYSNYTCWEKYKYPINLSNFSALNKIFQNSGLSFQQNLVLKSTSNSSVLWYQYVYFPFSHYFTLVIWGNSTNITSVTYPFADEFNFLPKEINLNYNKISNNTIQIVLNTTSPNKTFISYLHIPKGYSLIENIKGNTTQGYYESNNFEIDFSKLPPEMSFVNLFGERYYIIGENNIFNFENCVRK